MKNKILLLGAGIFVCSLFLSCSNEADNEHQAAKLNLEKNKTSMTIIFKAFETGKFEDMSSIIAPDIIDHNPEHSIKETGIEGLKESMEMYRGAFPDLKINVKLMTAEGDVVTSHYNMTGTNTGPMAGMPATNKRMNVDGVDILRFKDGKAVEHWGYFEEMKMMEQLGLIQEPAGMPMDPSMDVQD